jgi:3-dehydroquinate dehydratase/shikimate dehydrogenase
MICISIAQESRRMALADMVNASAQCDLLDVRLDRFAKAADVGELITHKPKPIILSCRRQQDGGAWRGSEEERLALLRQCIVSKADYVEIDLDVADEIRPFPPAKRVISYTNFRETPSDIAGIYAEAQTKHADVIKLETLARTPEEAWPLLQILAKPALPTVVVGLGKPGVMLSLLGKKIGSPWTYAALEKGMETYPGQPTVRELNEVYHYPAVGRTTRLIGVTGFGTQEYIVLALLNAVLAHHGLTARCLPLGVGSVPLFRKVMDAVRLGGVVVDAAHQTSFLGIATDLEAAAQEAQAVDLLVPKDKGWRGCNTLGPAALDALETGLRARSTEKGAGPVSTPAPSSSPSPLQGRMIMIVGANATARAIAHGIQRRGGLLILASRQRDTVLQLAQELQCRHISFEALYTTTHDILVVCDDEKMEGNAKKPAGKSGLHAGYLRPGMTVMDLTGAGYPTPLLHEAETRGCNVIAPKQALLKQLAAQAQLLTGKDTPMEVLKQTLGTVMVE